MKGIQYVACIPAALLILAAKVAHGYVQVQGYFELQDEYEDYYTDEQIQIDGKWIYTVASNIPDGFEYYYSDGRRLIEKFSEGRHLQSKSNMEDKVYGCKDFGLENIDNHRDFASWLKFAFESEYSVELIDDPNLPYGSQYDYQEENPVAYFNTANKDLTGPFKGRETMWIVDCISSEKIYFEREYRANPLEVKGFFELQDYYEDYYTDEDLQINGEWIYIVASNIPDGFNNLYDNESDNYYYDYYRKLKKYEEPNPNESLILPYPNEEMGIYGCKDFGLNDIDNGQNGIYHSNYSLETINDPTLPYGSQYDFKNEKEYFNTANKGELGPFTGNDGMWIVDCTLPEKAYFGENNCPEGNFFDTTTNRCFPIAEFPSESPNATPSLTISSSPSSSPVASPVAQPSPTPQNDCSDSPIGWHDTDGVAYNCQWYAQGAYCQDYGDHYADANGITANMACCACGGGTTNQPPSNPQTNLPTKAPTLSPTSSPTATPSLTISSSPSQAPTGTKVVCADDKDATFPLSNSNKSADCEWITKNKKRAEARKKKYCRLDYVKKICPMTCSMCPTM